MGAACTRPDADGTGDKRLQNTYTGAEVPPTWEDPRLASPPLPPKRGVSDDAGAGRSFLEEEIKRLQNENVLARARLAKADIEKDDKDEQNRLLAFQLGLLLDMYTLQMLDQERILENKQVMTEQGAGGG